MLISYSAYQGLSQYNVVLPVLYSKQEGREMWFPLRELGIN